MGRRTREGGGKEIPRRRRKRSPGGKDPQEKEKIPRRRREKDPQKEKIPRRRREREWGGRWGGVAIKIKMDGRVEESRRIISIIVSLSACLCLQQPSLCNLIYSLSLCYPSLLYSVKLCRTIAMFLGIVFSVVWEAILRCCEQDTEQFMMGLLLIIRYPFAPCMFKSRCSKVARNYFFSIPFLFCIAIFYSLMITGLRYKCFSYRFWFIVWLERKECCLNWVPWYLDASFKWLWGGNFVSKVSWPRVRRENGAFGTYRAPAKFAACTDYGFTWSFSGTQLQHPRLPSWNLFCPLGTFLQEPFWNLLEPSKKNLLEEPLGTFQEPFGTFFALLEPSTPPIALLEPFLQCISQCCRRVDQIYFS